MAACASMGFLFVIITVVLVFIGMMVVKKLFKGDK